MSVWRRTGPIRTSTNVSVGVRASLIGRIEEAAHRRRLFATKTTDQIDPIIRRSLSLAPYQTMHGKPRGFLAR